MGGIVSSKKTQEPHAKEEDLLSGKKIAALHSSIRWKKSDWEKNITCPEIINATDERTGNTSLHVAAQNGHLKICEIILKRGGKSNVQNATGQTPLHMATEYDYFWTCRLLIDNGADVDLKNKKGFAAKTGIDGQKTEDLLAAISDAHSETKLSEAFLLIEQNLNKVDTARYIYTYMQKKKNKPELWTKEVDDRARAIAKKLKDAAA